MPLPFETIVRGVSNYQAAVRQMAPAVRVVVRHDPDNPYDRNACAVLTTAGDLLGFLPAKLAERLVGTRPERLWHAIVSEVRPGETWGLSVKVGVQIDAAHDQAHSVHPQLLPDRGMVAARRRPNPAQAAAGAVEVASAQADAAQADGQLTPALLVFSPSGRLIGSLMRSGADTVVVRSARTGEAMTFPTSAVRLQPAA